VETSTFIVDLKQHNECAIQTGKQTMAAARKPNGSEWIASRWADGQKDRSTLENLSLETYRRIDGSKWANIQ
jgi:hypothetical protein